MTEEIQNREAEDFLQDLPLQTEEIGFKPDEMIVCHDCARTNPPNRVKCLYCGAQLELSEAQAAKVAPILRKPENWENGFNLIYLTNGEIINDETTTQVAKLVGTEKEVLQNIFDARKILPIVRTEFLQEAEILRKRLHEMNLETKIIADETLAAENFPKRLRGLEFADDKILLILFNNDEVEIINTADLCLLVSGAIFQKSVASSETRKKGETKILDASETASDEVLIDIYSRKDASGYRILTKGFDFSGLENEKGILARENIKKLAAKLQSVAPDAKLVEDYLPLRNVLGSVWEIEQRKDSQGLTRQRFGKFDLSNISTSNNLQQFTKFSRLQWHNL